MSKYTFVFQNLMGEEVDLFEIIVKARNYKEARAKAEKIGEEATKDEYSEDAVFDVELRKVESSFGK